MFDNRSASCSIPGWWIGRAGDLDPLVAKRLVDQGYDTKEKLSEWVWKNTMRTAKDFRESFLASFHFIRSRSREESPMPLGTSFQRTR